MDLLLIDLQASGNFCEGDGRISAAGTLRIKERTLSKLLGSKVKGGHSISRSANAQSLQSNES